MRLQFITGLVLGAILISCGGEKPEQKVIKPTSATKEVVTKEVPKEVPKEALVFDLNNKGVGPIKSVTLGEIDNVMVEKGKEIFKANCSSCHKIEKRFVGPALKGVTERRSPEWIMNMTLNPEEMVKKDSIAIKLLAEYNNASMANQNLSEEEARAILELLRTKN